MQDHLSISSHGGGYVSVFQADLQALQRFLVGELISPAHPSYERARRVWNGLIDKRPGLIVRCAGEADVAAAVRFAREHDLELAVRGGGHNVAGRALSDGGLVVDLSSMRRVQVNAKVRTVEVGGGTTLGDVDRATLPLGLAVPLGLVADTGVAGFTLHGGYGWLSRRYGLAVDNLLAARVVTADGRVLRASADENPDLFWAIRGGGGNFGVVTSFVFRLHPINPLIPFVFIIHPLDAADEAMRVFRDYMAEAPDELGALAVYWSAPALPGVPEKAHGAPALISLGVYLGPPEHTEKALKPLREAARPLADLSSPRPFSEVQRFFEEDYPSGRLYYWKSIYLSGLPDAAIAQATEQAAQRPSSINSMDFWALGGAIGRVPVEATAFALRHAPFLLGIEANWDDPSRTNDNIAWARGVYKNAERFARGETYLNFPGFAEEGEALVRGAYGPNYERLRALKARYDPGNLFQGNFNIEPAGE